jgi:hypothetical protein
MGMKTFTQWAENNKLELPAVSEDTKRGGIASWAYPDAYVRGQYPDLYFTPTAADAGVKLKGKKKNESAKNESNKPRR